MKKGTSNKQKAGNRIKRNVIKLLPDRRIYDEYTFIIGSMQHGTSYMGKSDETIKHHDNIIAWLKKRREEFKGNVL